MSLERFQVPHDPNSTHQLHWKPGEYGKGLFTDEGVLHNWSTGSILDGGISHRQYMMAKGMGDRYDINHPNNDLMFWIHPDGEVEALGSGQTWGDSNSAEAKLAQIQQIDPRLGPFAPNEWRFSDTRSQQRELTAAPQIVDPYNREWTRQPWDKDGYTGRRPFVYDEPTHTVYLGNPGEHHHDVKSRHGLPLGFGGYDGYAIRGVQDWPDEVSFFLNKPTNHPQVLEAVGKHVGLPVTNPLSDDMWNLSKVATDYGWDREGDVGNHPDIEWVPTAELRKFIEYDRRPGGADFEGRQERWEALSDHIKQHGFKDPVILEYNQDTGMAHMGEGNHRTWIALEHGIPAMPVRVYSGRRTSPTQVPVKLTPLPEWEDPFDPTGYHIPQGLKPSHIGLPTVPPPGQHEAAVDPYVNEFTVEDNDWERLNDDWAIKDYSPDEIAAKVVEGWQPGTEGKGITLGDGSELSWNVDDMGSPHHQAVAQALGLRDWLRNPTGEFHIDADGNRADPMNDEWLFAA